MSYNSAGAAARPFVVALESGRLATAPMRDIDKEMAISGKPRITARFLPQGRTRIANDPSEVSMLMSEASIQYNRGKISSGALMIGEGAVADVTLNGLGILLRGRPENSAPLMRGELKAIDGKDASALMATGVSPIKLIVPTKRENESPWGRELWGFQGSGKDTVKPVVLGPDDRVQFSLTDGKGKETYHRHNFTTEVYTMLRGSMTVRNIGFSGPTTRRLDAPFVLAIKPGISHMCMTEGISYVLQMSAMDPTVNYQMPIRYDRHEFLSITMDSRLSGKIEYSCPIDPDWIEWNA